MALGRPEDGGRQDKSLSRLISLLVLLLSILHDLRTYSVFWFT